MKSMYQYMPYNPMYDLKVEERKGTKAHHFKRRMRTLISMRILLRYKRHGKNMPKYGSIHHMIYNSKPCFKRKIEMNSFYKRLNK